MNTPLILAVAGHTNTGKTSLLRTLSRNTRFGDVAHRPGTTRHVEGVRLFVQNEPLLELYDTPGMEDPITLLDYLEQLSDSDRRLDGPERIAHFLQSAEAANRFEQEAKVLRQLLVSDAALYVIDVREPVLAKYRDELDILFGCGKPLLPVFNFTNTPQSRETEWKAALARLGLHVQVRFDTVAPPLSGENRLYTSLALLLENFRPQLERLAQDREQQKIQRHHQGLHLIAELLIDTAATRYQTPADDITVKQTAHRLQQQVRIREQKCVDELLRLYAFRPQDAQTGELPLLDGRWNSDLFSSEALRLFGIRIGKGIATGAAAGAGIDLLIGGLTLGAAAGLGALAGGALQTLHRYGKRLQGKIRGYRELTVDDSILQLLALRQQQLLTALERRGHAATQSINLPPPGKQQWCSGKLPTPLLNARAHPEWSSLNPSPHLEQPERGNQITLLSHLLQAADTEENPARQYL